MGARILYLAGGRSFGAASPPRKFSEIIQCWGRMGFAVELVCGGDLPGGAYHGEAVGERKALRRTPRWYRRLASFAPLVNSISEHHDIRHNAACLSHVRQLAGRARPDLIWERSCRLHDAGLIVARELNVPYVLEWKDHLIVGHFSWHRSRAVAMEQRKCREADWVVVESEVLRELLAREGVHAERLIVAHNAVDPGQFTGDPDKRAATRRQLGIAEDEFVAGYIGSYAFYHDTARLIRAAHLLRQREGSKVRVLMVGDGKEYPETRRLAEHSGLLSSGALLMNPRVPQPEVPGLLAALDVAVLPGSTDIICPIKVQEYMAVGLPTILPGYAANREVISEGETGLFFTPKDERSLADAIGRLAANRDLCQHMGMRARLAVRERFTWEKTWGAALEEVLRRSRREAHPDTQAAGTHPRAACNVGADCAC